MLRVAAVFSLFAFFSGAVHADENSQVMRSAAARARGAAEKLANAEHAVTPAWKKCLNQVNAAAQSDPDGAADYVQARYDYDRCFYLLAALTDRDPLYKDSIADLTGRIVRQDKGSINLIQKILNGVHRIAEISGLYADHLDVDRDLIENIMARLKYENKTARSSQQQLKFALDRAFEMLSAVAEIRKAPPEAVEKLRAKYTAADQQAQTIFQQINDGALALADLLELIAATPVPVPTPTLGP